MVKTAVRSDLTPVTVGLIAAGAVRLVLALETLSDGTRLSESAALIVIGCLTAAVAVLAQSTRIPPAVLVLASGAIAFLILA